VTGGVHLVGGGRGGDLRVWRAFLAEATARAARAPAGPPVVDEEVAEELEGLTVADGLGVVPFSVGVHAAQWGTLNRMGAAVELGPVPSGAAIDEDTAIVVRGDAIEVVGTGDACWVAPATGGVHVRREVSSSSRSR
jgi:cyanophycinase-like exopeptidase